jgi:hypothetical protein
MPHMSQAHQPHAAGMPQGVYAGVPAGYMPQPPWPQHMMAMPHSMAQGTAYGQPMQQYPLMGQPVAMQPDAQGPPAGVPFVQQLVSQAGPVQPMQASTLPPLAAAGSEAMAGVDPSRMEEELDMKPTSDAMGTDGLQGDGMSGMDGLGGFDGGMPDDGTDIGHIPEEMEEFLSILAKDEPIEG